MLDDYAHTLEPCHRCGLVREHTRPPTEVLTQDKKAAAKGMEVGEKTREKDEARAEHAACVCV